MAKSPDLNAILCRCPAAGTRSLEEFLNHLLDADLETLAQLPGSPGQVLCAQFTYYARGAVTLRESVRRKGKRFQALEDALQRLPNETKPSKKRKAGSHADISGTQAAAGS
ncbi:MAG: hypothetical protein HY291_21905 [Planctomycetes bacterium]|nr:hypothetical protein [Planctomycetota bacterium]